MANKEAIKMFIKRRKFLILSTVVFLAPLIHGFTAWSEKFAEPMLLSWSEGVKISDTRDKIMIKKKNLPLREKISIETDAKGFAFIALTKNEKILVGPNSRVLLPVISWEDGAVERIEIDKGSIRLINLTSVPRLIVTPLSRDVYSECDAIFEFDPEKGSVKVMVLEGRVQFRGLENEEFVPLNKEDSISFVGDREGGKPGAPFVFDTLLQGKRVARGHLTNKTKIVLKRKEDWWNRLEEIKKKLVTELAKKNIQRKKMGFICQKPEAKLNQCAWICKNNPKHEKKNCLVQNKLDQNKNTQCVRYRCDANGNWSDEFVLEASQSVCKAQPVVSNCDY